MIPFRYTRAADASDAVSQATEGSGTYLGGGTNLVDLMRETAASPSLLVDVSGLSREIRETEDGGLLVGAAVRNAELAAHPAVRERYPMLARAILSGASAQIRNMATVGGNVLQRTRCAYFCDTAGSRCNKRTPNQGCEARAGFNRIHAILGASDACVATHPSDMAVALLALGAKLHLAGPDGERILLLEDLYRLPGDRPDIETVLELGELIVALELPTQAMARSSVYRKVRDRASYAFALVSVAAMIEMKDGQVADARIALGGVAPKPWRAKKIETALIGRFADKDVARQAVEAEFADARPLRDNAFKIPLAIRTVTAVLMELARDQSEGNGRAN